MAKRKKRTSRPPARRRYRTRYVTPSAPPPREPRELPDVVAVAEDVPPWEPPRLELEPDPPYCPPWRHPDDVF